MDCPSARDQLAGWLDDELSTSARTLLDQHLERCDDCADLLGRMAARPILPPPQPDLSEIPGFWAPLDEALEACWDEPAAEEAVSPTPGAWWRREVRLSLPVAVLYAASLLLSLTWGMSNLADARDAEATLAGLQTPAPERTEGMSPEVSPGTAPPEPPPGVHTVAAYTPQRGTL